MRLALCKLSKHRPTTRFMLEILPANTSGTWKWVLYLVL